MKQGLVIDFAQRKRTPGPLVIGILLLSILALAHGAYLYLNGARANARQHKEHQQALTNWHASAPPAPPETDKLSPDTERAIAQAIDKLNVPWPQILSALEQSRPPDVALLKIEASQQNKRVLIQAQGKRMDSLLQLMDALPQKHPFVDVTPLLQGTGTDPDGRDNYNVTLEAKWSDAP